MTHQRAITFGCLLIAALLAATEAFAQDKATPNGTPCQAPAQQQSPNGTTGTAETDTDLSQCGGVIRPPISGDEPIEHRAPDVGKTPVIPPSAVPDQQQNDAEPK